MSDYNQQGRDYYSSQRPDPHYGQQVPRGPRVSFARLWAGGVGAAIVVALVIVVGVLLVRGVLGYGLLAPEGDGTYGNASTTGYALGGALVALLATALLTVLLLFMPNPLTLFTWIVSLCTAVAVLLPFTLTADHAAQFATAAINLVAGFALATVLGSAARASIEGPTR
ncbi:hypothetical protein BJY24_005398 [Nocardia transvalensis]|uniref:Uncharacterized protein n=1 Tax=Nocardia transvalensis TaxID=37333 RepID=A0A7W9UKI3_9NOCA|nr:DUF6069 family protein [Nocardia transvalensis]MBB5916486.1 hypothetical protein [Nocardia transvalensis]